MERRQPPGAKPQRGDASLQGMGRFSLHAIPPAFPHDPFADQQAEEQQQRQSRVPQRQRRQRLDCRGAARRQVGQQAIRVGEGVEAALGFLGGLPHLRGVHGQAGELAGRRRDGEIDRRRPPFQRRRGDPAVIAPHRRLVENALERPAARFAAVKLHALASSALDAPARRRRRCRRRGPCVRRRTPRGAARNRRADTRAGPWKAPPIAARRRVSRGKPANRLNPVAGEKGVADAAAPTPGLVRGVKEHFAGPDVLHGDHRRPPPIAAHARGVLGEHADAGLPLRGLDHPVERRQAPPNGAGLLRRVAQLHARAGKPKLRRLHDEPFRQRLAAAGARTPPTAKGRILAKGVLRKASGMYFGPAMRIIAPPLPGRSTKSAKCAQRRGAEQRGIDVAEDDDVVGEQIRLPHGKDRQGPWVLPGVLNVRLLQDRVQIDRFVPGEHVAEEAVLVARIRLREEDANLLLPHFDGPGQAGALRSASEASGGSAWMTKRNRPASRGRYNKRTSCDCPSAPTVASVRAKTSGFPSRRSTMGIFAPWKPDAVNLKRKATGSLTKTTSLTKRSPSLKSRTGRSLPRPMKNSGTPLWRA